MTHICVSGSPGVHGKRHIRDIIHTSSHQSRSDRYAGELLMYGDRPTSLWWLLMPWRQIGTNSTPTTMLTWLWLQCNMSTLRNMHIVTAINPWTNMYWCWKCIFISDIVPCKVGWSATPLFRCYRRVSFLIVITPCVDVVTNCARNN